MSASSQTQSSNPMDLIFAPDLPEHVNGNPAPQPLNPSKESPQAFDLKPFDRKDIGSPFYSPISTTKFLHRRQVWSKVYAASPNSTFPDQIYGHYVQPVMDYFHQMTDPLTTQFTLHREDLGDRGILVKFSLDRAPYLNYPNDAVLIALSPGTLKSNEWRSFPESKAASQDVSCILEMVVESVPAGSWALVSDVQTALLLRLGAIIEGRTIVYCEVIYSQGYCSPLYGAFTSEIGPSLRLCLTALLYQTTGPYYVSYNTSDEVIGGGFVGALNNPELPLESDEAVLAGSKSMADFDLYTLLHDRPRAVQFFKWKTKASKDAYAHPLYRGHVINAETNAYEKRAVPSRNPHPLIPLPAETEDYIKATTRPRPTDLQKTLRNSQTFSLQITKVLKSNKEPKKMNLDIASVCECRVLEIDGAPAPADMPKLCVKILDDRLLNMPGPNPKKKSVVLAEYFHIAFSSEDLVRWEDAAYRRLEHVQGSVVPYYYGCHIFTLPDGHQCYGILMEFVEGPTFRDSKLREAPEEEQIEFIHAARHAVRVLQRADVTQRDWHEDQLIYHKTSDGKTSCVFIDFGSSLHSTPGFDSETANDYEDVFNVLRDDEVGFDGALVKKHFGPKERWDYHIKELDITRPPVSKFLA